MLFESVANVLNPNQKKERLREAIKEVFDLEHKDIIIFKHNDIFIKRWGDAPLIPLGLIEQINEEIAKECQRGGAEDGQPINITISTPGLLSHFGLAPENLPTETKEKLKYRIRERAGLCDKDVVLFLNDKLIIKKFKQQIIFDGEEEKPEQRHAGLSKEALSDLRAATFENEVAERDILDEIMEGVLQNDLDFGKITNDFFIKNVAKILHKAVFKFLKANLQDPDPAIEGLTGFLLREHWTFIHKKMAYAILSLTSQKNPVTESFIKKYSGEIEVDNGQKFKLPEILDKNGAKWNVSSIYGVATQRKKIVDSANFRQKSLDNLKKSIEEAYLKVDLLNDEAIQNEKDIANIEELLQQRINAEAALNARIQELGERLRKTNNPDEKMKIRTEVDEKTLEIKRLLIKGGNLTTEKKRLELQTKQIAAKKEKNHYDIPRLQKRYREDEAELVKFLASQKDIDEKYETLAEALAEALTKRRAQI